jgi:hypothetical protein
VRAGPFSRPEGPRRPGRPGREGAARSRSRKTAAPVAAVPDDFPAAPKIRRILDTASETGWAAEVADLDPATGAARVRVVRDGVEIVTAFVAGKLDLADLPRRSEGDTSRQLKNVSAVLHAIAALAPARRRRREPAGR